MPGKLIRQKWITRADLRANPKKLYVFGDNMQREGMGGQAREMRHEPNAIGIPTKWSPGMGNECFFKDADFTNPIIILTIIGTLAIIRKYLDVGEDVVLPTDSIGTGLSELPIRAPAIHAYIESALTEMATQYG